MAAHYGCTQGELLGRFTSPEISEMLAFEAEYGFPDAFFTAGQICATIAAFGGDGKTKWHPADFVPYFESARPRQTTRDHKAMFKALAERHT